MELKKNAVIGVKKGTRVYNPGKKSWYIAKKSYKVSLKTVELPPKSLLSDFQEKPMCHWKSGHRWRTAYLYDLFLVDPVTGEWTPLTKITYDEVQLKKKNSVSCHDCVNWQAGCRYHRINETMIDLGIEIIEELPYPDIQRLHFNKLITSSFSIPQHCDKYCENSTLAVYLSD